MTRTRRERISAGGASAFAVSGDLHREGCRRRLDAVLTRFGTPDIIVNNAGRSIRRSVADSTGRMHDFQRTMAINYFGPIGLTLGVLDEFLRRDSGQFINVCTWGVTNGSMPRFAAYAASKAALAAFGRSLAAELLDTGVSVTNVLPAGEHADDRATAEYERVPSLSAHDAGEWIVYAAKHRPLEIMPLCAAPARRHGDLGVVGRRDTRTRSHLTLGPAADFRVTVIQRS